MNRSIIRKIAKQNGVSESEVRREMEYALNLVYSNPNAAAMAVQRKGASPTPEEFIDYCAGKIKTKPVSLQILH